MLLVQVFIVGLGLCALLRFLIMPRLKTQFQADRGANAVKQAAILSVLGVLSTVVTMATITAGFLIATIWILEQFGSLSFSTLEIAVSCAQQIRSSIAFFSPMWSMLSVLVLTTSMGVYAYRRSKLRMNKVLDRVVEAEIARVRQQMENGEYEQMPPTSQMNDVAAQHRKLVAMLEQVQNSDTPELQAALPQLRDTISKLEQFWLNLDFNRRLNIRMTPGDVEFPKPATRLQRLQYFLMSEGLVSSLGTTSRWAYLAALALLIPSLLGVASGPIQAALSQRIVKLSDLRVEWDVAKAERDWEKAKNGLASVVTPDNEKEEDEQSVSADHQAIQAFAAAFEYAVADRVIGRNSVWSTEDARSVRSVAIRQKIISNAGHFATTSREITPQLSVSPHLTNEQQAMVGLVENHEALQRPVTKLGKELADDLERLSKNDAGFRTKLRSQLSAFQRPAGSEYLVRSMASNLFGSLLQGEGGEIGNLLENAIRNTETKTAANRIATGTKAAALTDLSSGLTADETLERTVQNANRFAKTAEVGELLQLQRDLPNRVPASGDVINKLREFPPSISSIDEPHVRTSLASNQVSRLTRVLASDEPFRARGLADCLAEYRDWFPSYTGADRVTERGQLLDALERKASIQVALKVDADFSTSLNPFKPSSLSSVEQPNVNLPETDGGGGGGGGGGKNVKSTASSTKSNVSPARSTPRVSQLNIPSTGVSTASRASFARASSFRGLRGFSRVGGVLIGRAPEQEDAVCEIKDIRWTIADQYVRLYWLDGNGIEYQSCRFRIPLVTQAIAYAADNRPLAVTMVKADPLPELKILTHPALIDSGLGQRVIEIDRFVDRYTADVGGKRALSMAFVTNATELYRYAWARRLVVLQESMPDVGKYFGDARTTVEALFQKAKAIVSSESIRQAATRALSEPSKLGDVQWSPLTAKPEFFDPTLVAEMLSNNPLSIDKFDARISALVENHVGLKRPSQPNEPFSISALEILGNDKEFDPNIVVPWFSAVPEYQIWSGVRESSYDCAVAQLLPQDGQSTKSPISYMLQISFTSNPGFLDREPNATEGQSQAAVDYTDEHPWEFPGIAKDLQGQVEEILKQSENERERIIAADVNEFIYLQRFFRNALVGRFGLDFPLDKLVALQEECLAIATPSPYRTMRWNSRDGSIETQFLVRLASSGTDPLKLRTTLDRVNETNDKSALFVLANQATAGNPKLERAIRLLEENDKIRDKYFAAMKTHLKQLDGLKIPDENWFSAWERGCNARNAEMTKWHEKWEQLWQDESTPLVLGDDFKELKLEIDYFNCQLKIRKELGLWVDDCQSLLEGVLPLSPL